MEKRNLVQEKYLSNRLYHLDSAFQDKTMIKKQCLPQNQNQPNLNFPQTL